MENRGVGPEVIVLVALIVMVAVGGVLGGAFFFMQRTKQAAVAEREARLAAEFAAARAEVERDFAQASPESLFVEARDAIRAALEAPAEEDRIRGLLSFGAGIANRRANPEGTLLVSEAPVILASALEDESRLVRNVAAAVAATLGEEAEPLVGGLRALLAEAGTREGAIVALGRIGPAAADAADDLATCLSDESPGVRRRAAEALGQLGPDGRSALPRLESVLDDADPDVRRAVAEAMARLRASD